MKKLIITLLSVGLLGAVGCGDTPDGSKKDPDAQSTDPACKGLTNKKCDEKKEKEKAKEKQELIKAKKKESNETYAKIVYQSYSDSLEMAKKLQTAINDFVAAPSADGLTKARKAWKASRPTYLQTEAYRFYDGPINAYPGDNDNPVQPNLTGVDGDLETYINAWPLDEAYIDYVQDDADQKIMPLFEVSIIGNKTEYPIAKLQSIEAVRKTNFAPAPKPDIPSTLSDAEKAKLKEEIEQYRGGELEDGKVEANTSTGYHAIEFMLWGQDRDPDGPGNRPYTDYTETDYGERRCAYLKTIAQALVDDLTWLTNMWDPQQKDKNYLKTFLAEDNVDASFKKSLDGIQQLTISETGGERVAAALRSGNQEEEHSCFSDNTHVDMIEDVQGILNVWKGSYKKSADVAASKDVSGTGIKDVMELYNAEQAQALTTQLEKALTDANDLVHPNEAMNKYFDQLIDKAVNATGYARVMLFAMDMFETRPMWKELYTAMGAQENGGIETCIPGYEPNSDGTGCVKK